MKEKLPLDQDDVKKLKKHLIPMFIFPFFVAGIFGTFVHFFFSDFGDDQIAPYAFSVFALFFFGVIGYIIWSAIADLQRGFKYRIEGKITDKRLDIRRTGGTGTGSKSKTTRHYYLYIDNEEYTVDYREYTRVNVGAYVVMDKAPKSNLTLSLEITEAELSQEDKVLKEESNKEVFQFLKTDFPEVKFNDKDYEILMVGFKSYTVRKFIFMLPFLFIVFSLIYSDMIGFLIILFPIVVVPIIQAITILRKFTIYLKNRNYAHKKGIPAIVKDKLTVTSNRSKNKSQIITSSGSFEVGSYHYDKIASGDKIIIFKPKYGKNPLSIMTMDEEEVYIA